MLLFTLLGCGGGANTQAPTGGGDIKAQSMLFSVRMNPQAVEESGGWPAGPHAASAVGHAGLPAPSALMAAPAAAKRSSYTDAGLLKTGAEYDSALPYSRVSTAAAPSLIFSPVWGAAAQPQVDDAAYCIYRFGLDGYAASGKPQTLALSWGTAGVPADYADYWLGLANRDADRWDWFAGPQDGVLTLASFAPYTAPGGDVLVAVVILGSSDCALAELKIGQSEQRSTGTLFSEPGGGYPVPPSGMQSLPESVDLSPDCSPVGDQGQIASDTSFATARGAFDYQLGQVYGVDGWDFSDSYNLSSTKYLYLVTGWEQGLGCGPEDGRNAGGVVDYLSREGDASELNAPYVNICDADWGQDAEDDAALLGADGYTPLAATGVDGVATLKHMLAVQRKVVVFQTGVNWDFFMLPAGAVWEYDGGGIAGYHTMALVGFDDAQQAFKVRNSWGADWSEGGYCWIGYQTFITGAPELALQAWTLDVDYHGAVAERFCGQQQELAPPTNLQASDGTDPNVIHLSWEKSAGATSYKIYRDEAINPVLWVGDVDQYDDAAVTDYLAHTYWVQATDGVLDSALCDPDDGFRSQAPVITRVSPLEGNPGADVTFHAVVDGGGTLQYAWDFGGGATPDTTGEISPTVTLGVEGDYNASLTVTNEFGEDTYTFTLHVEFVQLRLALTNPPLEGTGTAADPYIADVATDYVFSLMDATDGDVSLNPHTTYMISAPSAGSIPPGSSTLNIDDQFSGTFTVTASYPDAMHQAVPPLYFYIAGRDEIDIYPDPADEDWSTATGEGTLEHPYVLLNDWTRKYSLLADDTIGPGGNQIPVDLLEWNAMPPFICTWVAPGTFKVSTFTSGYVFAICVETTVASKFIYIEVHNLP